MPTPSNNPPPELPPRSYSSSCPDDVRVPAPALHRPATLEENSEAMQVDSNDGTPPAPPSSSSRGPTRGVPPPPPSEEPVVLIGDDEDEDEEESMQSHAGLSPRPDSRSGAGTAHTSPLPADPDEECDDEDDAAAAAGRASTKALETTGAAAIGSRDLIGSRDVYGSPGSESYIEMPDDLVSRLAEGTLNRDLLQSFELPPMGYDTTNARIIPSLSSSFLRPGSKFKGTQQSERQIYDVQVEIKNVDLRESFLCGYLKIQGLTEDNPTLTTYFEGEIIGPQHGFLTKHSSWGATDKIDLNHWNKFSAFRPFAKQAKRGTVHIQRPEAQENIFMRWKELFLVPNHLVRTINGASFEGFYYICFNQREGGISGIYYHARSEKFQQLELKHVDDRGCFAAMELR